MLKVCPKCGCSVGDSAFCPSCNFKLDNKEDNGFEHSNDDNLLNNNNGQHFDNSEVEKDDPFKGCSKCTKIGRVLSHISCISLIIPIPFGIISLILSIFGLIIDITSGCEHKFAAFEGIFGSVISLIMYAFSIRFIYNF